MLKNLSFKKEYVSYGAVLLVGLFLSAMAASASTTISTNVNTGGTLTVTGASTLTGAVNASSTIAASGNMTVVAGYGLDTAGGGALNIGTTTATSVIIGSSSAKVGIASTTPWAQLSVNPNALGTNVPNFVVGSSSATNFIVANTGFVGVGSTSPSAALGVVGTTTASAGMIIGGSGNGISQLLFGTCTLTSGAIVASTTLSTICTGSEAVTGTGYRVFVTPNITQGKDIVFSSASSTALGIQITLANINATGVTGTITPTASVWSWMAMR